MFFHSPAFLLWTFWAGRRAQARYVVLYGWADLVRCAIRLLFVWKVWDLSWISAVRSAEAFYRFPTSSAEAEDETGTSPDLFLFYIAPEDTDVHQIRLAGIIGISRCCKSTWPRDWHFPNESSKITKQKKNKTLTINCSLSATLENLPRSPPASLTTDRPPINNYSVRPRKDLGWRIFLAYLEAFPFLFLSSFIFFILAFLKNKPS